MSDAASPIPDDVEALAAERVAARAERDFARADELRARIEAAGWKVVDDGPRYTLSPARPPDAVDVHRSVYGSPETVPSRLETPATAGATVIVLVSDAARAVATASALATATDIDLVLVSEDGAVDRSDLLARLRAATGRDPVEVGGQGSAPDSGEAMPAPGTMPAASVLEVLWTRGSFAPASALAAGLRRAGREHVIVIEAGVEPEGDPLGPVAAALADPSVAVVGADGLTSSDLHRFRIADAGDSVVAVGPGVTGFRRADAGRLLAIDERLASPAGAIAWSSLALRERGDGETRRALVVWIPVRDRPPVAEVGRRDRYRIAARFGEDAELRD